MSSQHTTNAPTTQETNQAPRPQSSQGENHGSLSFLQLLQSTLWAAVGVQKRQNRIRDFSRGNPLHFIAMGVLFTATFVLLMIGLVKLILSFQVV